MHLEQAGHESQADPVKAAFWLRGLGPVDFSNPLITEFSFTSTFETPDIPGAFVGGDGSGGINTRDARKRRCGFVMVAIRPTDEFPFEYLGHAFGRVPGKHTTPRDEAMAILFTLMYINGTGTYLCDNRGVADNYNKGNKYSPNSNGLLWSAMQKARESRLASGNGF